MFKYKKSVMACVAVLSFHTACSDSKSENSQNTEFFVSEATPSDSTGATGTMNVNFASLKSMGLKLVDAPTSIAIGTDIELSYAKFNLAKIRVKALKELTADEKTQESLESEEEKASVKEVEKEVGDDTALHLEKGGKSEEDRKAERAAKVAEKAAKLDAKEQSAIKKESNRDKATKWSGPYVFDAVAGKIEGDVPAISLLDGSYRRVEFQMKRNFSAAAGESILGNVFAIRGTVLKDGVKIPFEIDWHVALNFRLAGEGAITVKPSEENEMIINFDLVKWFDGIDLKTATVEENGTIYINKNSNKDVMKKIHHNIKINSHFGKDVNKDGKLEDSEKAGQGEEAADATVE
jgi:hypothetical protein